MIEFLSSWAKGLGLSIIIVSILEMLLPEGKNKKYIRMVMGIYIIFSIISPFVKNDGQFDINQIDIDEYLKESIAQKETNNVKNINKNVEEVSIKQLEKNVIERIEKEGYKVSSCNIYATINMKDNELSIKEIKIKIDANEDKKDFKEIKKILIDEYEVNEGCLEIS